MTPIQEALMVAPTAALAVTSAVAFRFRKSAVREAAANKRLAEAEQRIAQRDEEAGYLVATRLPALLYAWQTGAQAVAPEGCLLHPALVDTPAGRAYQAVLEQVHALLSDAEARAEGAAKAAVQAATRSLQSLGYELQTEVTALTDSAHDDKTLARIQPIDHVASQSLRRLQVLGVLTGMWPGRQHDDAPLLDVVRGGVGRIRDYRRVKTPAALSYYLDGRVVEPLALVMGELLDNAARHSAPSTPVEVSFQETHRSVSIEIHDAGPGMTPEARQKAEQLLSTGESVRFTALGNPAVFGLAGVGALAARYGLRVSIDDEYSRLGGCRAVVQVPRSMFVAPPPEPVRNDVEEGLASEPVERAGVDDGFDRAADGLPVRRRRQRPQAPMPDVPASEPPPAEAGLGLAAFVNGTRDVHYSTPVSEETTS